MKIPGSGPGASVPPPEAPVEKAGIKGVGFAQKLDEAAAAEKVGGAAAVRGTPSPEAVAAIDMVKDVSADLNAGKISPQAAVDKIVGRVLDAQLGKDASPAVREKVEAALREALASDPLLLQKVGSLGS